MAFRELVEPATKVHFLVAPKREEQAPLTNLTDVRAEDAKVMGHLMVVVAKVARQEGLVDGYRTVINNGDSAKQTIKHLLIHVLGGQQLTWPPENAADPSRKASKLEEEKASEST